MRHPYRHTSCQGLCWLGKRYSVGCIGPSLDGEDERFVEIVQLRFQRARAASAFGVLIEGRVLQDRTKLGRACLQAVYLAFSLGNRRLQRAQRGTRSSRGFSPLPFLAPLTLLPGG